MIQKYNNMVAQAYIGRLRAYLNGELEIPASKLNKRPHGIHQSNLNDNSCILKGYYANTSEPKEVDDESILRFSVGRALERVLSFCGELEPRMKDGIWVTPDDSHPEFGITEIKYTTSTSLSDVQADFPQWISQMKNQCYVFEEDHVNLVAYFAVGNMPSYAVWNIRNLPKDTVYQGVALKAWTFEFTEEELRLNWLKVLERSEILADAILAKVPVHRDVVLEQLPFNLKKGSKVYWQCKKCQLDCYLKDELNGK